MRASASAAKGSRHRARGGAASIQRNFKQWGQATPIRARDRSAEAMDALAVQLAT